jgi:hypothetical protein
MKVVFISGAYRAKNKEGVKANIQHAREAAEMLWQTGYCVITPHLNTAFMDGVASDTAFLEGDIEILKRCDAIYMLKGWESSIGACEELRIAIEYGLEVIYEP